MKQKLPTIALAGTMFESQYQGASLTSGQQVDSRTFCHFLLIQSALSKAMWL